MAVLFFELKKSGYFELPVVGNQRLLNGFYAIYGDDISLAPLFSKFDKIANCVEYIEEHELDWVHFENFVYEQDGMLVFPELHSVECSLYYFLYSPNFS
jgi:hypothetical protein